MPPPEDTIGPSSSPSQAIKKRVAAFYDANADEYLAWTTSSHPVRLRYLSQLLPHLQSRDRTTVLELGCGAGVPCTQVLASQPNVYITGVDISGAQLELAAKALPVGKVSLVRSDMMALEFEDASFDAVVAFYSIIHVPRDEQPMLMARIARWLKPAGMLLATLSVDGAEEGTTEKGWMFWSGFDRSANVKMVADAGLEVVVNEIANTEEVVHDEDGGQKTIEIPHLWIIARKHSIA